MPRSLSQRLRFVVFVLNTAAFYLALGTLCLNRFEVYGVGQAVGVVHIV